MNKLAIDDIEKWMTNYYKNPQSELTPQMIVGLSKEGKLNDERAVVQIMYFFALIFRENSSQIIKLTSLFMTTLSLMEKEVLVTAIWLSNTEMSKEYLNKWKNNIPELKEYINELLVSPVLVIEKVPIDNPEILDALWAAFMATGNEKYIFRIISTLEYCHDENDEIKRLIGNTAKWSIESNMENHPKIRLICMEILRHQNIKIQSILKAILKN